MPPSDGSGRSAGPSRSGEPDGPTPGQLRRYRAAATILFLLLISTWVVAASGQIVRQAMLPAPKPVPYATCQAGLRALHGALERARASAEGDLDPDAALRRFREEILPEWEHLEGTRQLCAKPEELRSLDALERLRYAEEHAVRREAASLAALRRQVASQIPPSAP